jgi:hypothetical protein
VTPGASCPIVLALVVVVVIDLLRWQTQRGEDEHENDWGGRVRLRPSRGFLGRLADRRDPLRNWSTIDRGNTWGFMS